MLLSLGNNKPSITVRDLLEWNTGNEHDYLVQSFTNYAARIVYISKLNDNVIKFLWQSVSSPRAEFLTWFIALEKVKIGSFFTSMGHNFTRINLMSFLFTEYINCSTYNFFLMKFLGRFGAIVFNGGILQQYFLIIQWSLLNHRHKCY